MTSDNEWKLWYDDMFDRETPRMVEASGTGLVVGLVELWNRFLIETVQPSGMKGFSRFNLWWRHSSVEIEGEMPGAVRLRGWVTADKVAGQNLIHQVAQVHARLLLAGQDSVPILAAAAIAGDQVDFQDRLAKIGS